MKAYMMTVRLILAILSTLLEEAALVVIVLWGLPRLDITLPLAGLITLMAVWAAFSVFTYRMGSKALRKKPMDGLPAMVGSSGKVVSPLALEGLIKVKSELWIAKSDKGNIDVGEEVTITGQDGLKLIVHKSKPSASKVKK
jgi:membrane protein implicated in regulation of membrane protease activity